MPVRSEDRSYPAFPACFEHGHEHGGDPVECGAPGLGDRAQGVRRVEALAGKHHRRPLGHAAQRAHHHPEAVVERYRDAQPIVLGEAHAVGDDPGVVDDVVVGQRRALGRAGGAGGELDVDRIVGVEGPRHRFEAQRLRRTPELLHVAEPEHSRPGVLAHRDHDSQVRQPGRREPPGLAAFELRRQSANHVEVSGGLECFGRDQRLASDRVQGVLQLDRPVGRVDVDEHRAEPGGGELGQDPFEPVGRPDPDAVALVEPEREQSAGDGIDLPVKIVVAQGLAFSRQHHRVARAVAGHGVAQRVRDRRESQRRAPVAGDVGAPVSGCAEVRMRPGAGARGPCEPPGLTLGENGHACPPLRDAPVPRHLLAPVSRKTLGGTPPPFTVSKPAATLCRRSYSRGSAAG